MHAVVCFFICVICCRCLSDSHDIVLGGGIACRHQILAAKQ